MLPISWRSGIFLIHRTYRGSMSAKLFFLFHHTIYLYLTFSWLLRHWWSPSAYASTVGSRDLFALATPTARGGRLLNIRRQLSSTRFLVSSSLRPPVPLAPDLMRVWGLWGGEETQLLRASLLSMLRKCDLQPEILLQGER
ncbi:rCG24147 [Rattus norvegicus]|uniref:RCG24147 n=1 Tax=Rattus norvegicus TaxID=10116 RepID=A6KB09_RAT|nr:rCG24147 [Rattus norvegicus]